jgi:nitronate monooxygenase
MPLRTKAEAAGSSDFSALWTGQAGPLAREMPAADLTVALAEEALQALRQLATRG